MDRATCGAWVAPQLVPALRPGDVDNLSAHTGPRVRAPVAAAGAEVRYLPPYGPDLNPIEKAWSKLKARLRAAGRRTAESLWQYLGEFIDAYSPAGCRNDSRSCGYPAATPTPEPL